MMEDGKGKGGGGRKMEDWKGEEEKEGERKMEDWKEEEEEV